jgi:hypothetical protein
VHRNAIIVAGGILTALVVAWQIANETLWLSGLIGGVLLLWLGTLVCSVRADALVAGIAMAGYLIGNRGFAQLSLPTVPLLPGELTLALGVSFAVWEAARSSVLPWRRDFLNGVLLTWLAFGAVRFGFDVRAHGFVALRDFAIMYYAVFFFLAQAWWADPERRRWLQRCLSVGFALGAPTFLAFNQWPDFFARYFSLGGVPLIFIKSDVQAGLMVAGTFWFLHRYAATRRPGWLLLAIGNLLGVAFANSRAGLLALLCAGLWTLLCREWRLFRPLATLGTVGLLLLVIAPLVTQTPWKRSLANRYVETISSVFDVRGARSFSSEELGDKPDNNLFRLTWWRSVVDETWMQGRWLGLGFGYDLSDQFMRVYYTEGSEEFNARSPHNYPLTIFGRTGLVGVGLLAIVIGVMTRRTWRAGRLAARSESPSQAFSLWVGAWGIFVSACFGVVLEGPMGATLFWCLLGMASTASAETAAAPATPTLAGHSLPADETLRRDSAPSRGDLGTRPAPPDRRQESPADRPLDFASTPANSP